MRYVKAVKWLFLVALFGVSMTSCAVLGLFGGSAKIFLTSPLPGSTVTITSNHQKITLKGSVDSDVDIDTVTVNPNGDGFQQANFFAGDWDIDLEVTPQDYKIEVTADDVNGSESKATFSFTVVLDTSAASSTSSTVSSDNSSSTASSTSSTVSSDNSSSTTSSISSSVSSDNSSSTTSSISSSVSSSATSSSAGNPLPEVSITAPIDGSTTNVTSLIVSGTASVDAQYSVTKVQVSANGSAYFDATGTTSWSASVTLPEGTNTIQARAIADSGKTNTSTVIKVIVQTLWRKTYGGTDDDRPYSIVATSDGGFAVAGYTYSFGAGSADIWVIKLDANGNTNWAKTYGGTEYDAANSIVQTSDGGFAVAGSTYSSGAGNSDFWVLKLNGSGNMMWSKTYGGTNSDQPKSIVATSNGGFAVAGYTQSFGAGNSDIWVLKLDASGNTNWAKTYGGTDMDTAKSIVATSDGGFAVAGSTSSSGAGNSDFWVLKLDASGNTSWSKTYGGTDYDLANSIVKTSDGGFAVAGRTQSFGAGSYDFWVLKLDASGNTSWSTTYGGTGDEEAYSIVQTSDGGFAVAGWTSSYGAGGNDIWVLKLDASGNTSWSTTYGGSGYDEAYSIVTNSYEGFTVAGLTTSYGAGSYDCWILKLDANGN